MFGQTFRERVAQRMNLKDEEKLYKRNGILYPKIVCPQENLDALMHLEAREDDVFLAVYPKCGCNWVGGVLRKILVACGYTLNTERPPLIEFHTPEEQKIVAQLPSRRFFATHVHPDDIPASFKTNKTKILVVLRNPKDTAVSYYHFMNNNPLLPNAESWDKFLSDFMSGEVSWGSYFDHAMAWEKHMDDPNVMIVTYEELKENLPEYVKKIADFFSFPLTNEQVQGIAGQSTFKAMVLNSDKTHGNMGGIFFRKGEIGDWRNHFSEAQSQQMDEEFRKKLSGTKVGAKLKYETYCM